MNISVLLHFYQPFNQQEDIFERIVAESYIPLIQGFLDDPSMHATFNISGVLFELLLEHNHKKLIDDIGLLLSRGQVEITSSAKYHAILPLLPEEERTRQIDMHDLVCKKCLNDAYEPLGFFSPEMAVNNDILKQVAQRKLEWIALPELASEEVNRDFALSTNHILKDSRTNLSCLFRNKRVSSLMLSGVCRTAEDFIHETQDLHARDKYWFAVMDAETFGHHRIGHEKFLFELLKNPFFTTYTVTGLLKSLENSHVPMKTVAIRPSTWSNVEQDFWLDKDKTEPTDANSFILWKDPSNPIHALQWELTYLVLNSVNSYMSKNDNAYLNARKILDSALSSDQYWWASAKPWWSLEMLEQGAYQLKSVVSTLNPKDETMLNAERIYSSILACAFEWQRTGIIRKTHLEASSTFMKAPFKQRAPEEWFNQVLLEFEDEMQLAANKKDFEKAIKWRDAILKLNLGTDIFDVLHVVDELWTVRTLPSVKPIMEHKWEELSPFIRQYLLNISTKEDFDKKKALR